MFSWMSLVYACLELVSVPVTGFCVTTLSSVTNKTLPCEMNSACLLQVPLNVPSQLRGQGQELQPLPCGPRHPGPLQGLAVSA